MLQKRHRVDFRKQLLAADVSEPILMLRPVLSGNHTHATASLFFLTASCIPRGFQLLTTV
jgi:hypothetical protein